LSHAHPNDQQKVPQGWPSKGAIEFKNVTMSYRDELSPALRNMSVIIHGNVPNMFMAQLSAHHNMTWDRW
jgi:ABC-type bacteriocin/lantibiotic exporter with double-glycine peptidase domain